MTVLIAYADIRQPFPFDEIPDELVPEKLRHLPEGNARVQQRHQCRRLAHFLLWQLLKRAEKPTSLLSEIHRTESGRPYFPAEMLDFNMSHSGDWVAVILKTEKTQSVVGIDIEFPKTRNFLALMTYFSPPHEVAWFQAQERAEVAFYRCWCLREAVLKSQGAGIVKLSEVHHFPLKKQIFSNYCPLGELFFTEELPFYFAAFANQRQNSWHVYHWNSKKLTPKKLKFPLRYEVNEC